MKCGSFYFVGFLAASRAPDLYGMIPRRLFLNSAGRTCETAFAGFHKNLMATRSAHLKILFVRRALICVSNFAIVVEFRSRGKGLHASCP